MWYNLVKDATLLMMVLYIWHIVCTIFHGVTRAFLQSLSRYLHTLRDRYI